MSRFSPIPKQPKKPVHRSSNRGGFALVVALSLMAFVLLLLLSFSTLVTVEMSNAQLTKKQLLARENARLGLMIAIGNLQSSAGPDQRVSTRADLLGNGNFDPNSKFWTGIWSYDPTGILSPTPRWLVSGQNPDPAIGAGSDYRVLFPSTQNEEEVRVPTVQIEGEGTQSGEFAYWIADEGIKASAVARRGAISRYAQSTPLESQRRITEYQVPFGVGLNSFFDKVDLDLEDQSFASSLERVLSYSDIEFVRDSSNNPLAPANGSFSEIEHDLTTLALGVLTNPIDGGLKKNLSDPSFTDSFLATSETQEFLANKGNTLTVESGLPSRRSFSGKPYHSPRPLLTEVVLYIGLFHTWSDAKLRIRYHVEAEFTNPYSLPLRFPQDNDTRYDRGMVLLFDNLPTITVEDTSINTLAPMVTEDLNSFSAYSSNDSRRTINSWFEIAPTGTPNVPVLNPGEVYRVMEPNPATQRRGLARDFGTTRWSTNQNTKPDDDAQIRISATHPAEGVTLTVVPYGRSGDPTSRPPILKYEGLVFDDFEVLKVFNDGVNPFSRSTSSSYVQEDYLFAYHFRIKTDESDLSSMRNILTAVDLRDPDIDATDTYTDIDGVEKSVSEILDPSYTDPSFIIQDPNNLFSLLDQVMDPTGRSHSNDYRDTYLFDMPNDEVLSVGQLSGLHIYRRKPRSIGSPWGEDFNEAFDRYYFSPKQTDPTSGDPFLSSPAIVHLNSPAATANENDASNEMVVGSFNINSTSVDAWESVLSSPVLTPEAADENIRGSADVSRAATFFRLPQFQSQEDEFFVTTPQIQQPNRFFQQGLRSLHGSDGELQLREIAENIVDALQTRGQPFTNMKDFVNSGILRDAINKVGNGGTATVPAINEGLMEFSNVYLTQNEVLTKIAPQASTRSDTFKVRAYGAAKDPITGKIHGSAWCEATVQRLPEKYDGSDPLTLANETNPRKFQIINIRWLNDDRS